MSFFVRLHQILSASALAAVIVVINWVNNFSLWPTLLCRSVSGREHLRLIISDGGDEILAQSVSTEMSVAWLSRLRTKDSSFVRDLSMALSYLWFHSITSRFFLCCRSDRRIPAQSYKSRPQTRVSDTATLRGCFVSRWAWRHHIYVHSFYVSSSLLSSETPITMPHLWSDN